MKAQKSPKSPWRENLLTSHTRMGRNPNLGKNLPFLGEIKGVGPNSWANLQKALKEGPEKKERREGIIKKNEKNRRRGKKKMRPGNPRSGPT